MSTPEISVVIPAHNEAENLARLLPEIGGGARRSRLRDRRRRRRQLRSHGRGRPATRLRCGPVRVVRHARSFGQSAALWSGVNAAKADIVATLDGDGQNDPALHPRPRRGASTTPPSAWRRAAASAAAHRWPRRSARGSPTASAGRCSPTRAPIPACGAKAFRREAFLRLPYFEPIHRFLPALFLADGWRVVEVDVVDRPREHGTSHYGIIDRLVVGIPDLFGVWWLTRRRRRSPFRREGKSR